MTGYLPHENSQICEDHIAPGHILKLTGARLRSAGNEHLHDQSQCFSLSSNLLLFN